MKKRSTQWQGNVSFGAILFHEKFNFIPWHERVNKGSLPVGIPWRRPVSSGPDPLRVRGGFNTISHWLWCQMKQIKNYNPQRIEQTGIAADLRSHTRQEVLIWGRGSSMLFPGGWTGRVCFSEVHSSASGKYLPAVMSWCQNLAPWAGEVLPI